MLEITAERMERAVKASERYEPEKISRKLTISRLNNATRAASVVLVVPSDLYYTKDEFHHKPWRGERLKDGSLLFRPQ